MPKTKVSISDIKTAKDTDNVEEISFRGGGIKLTPIEPMRKWRLEFEGNLHSLVSSNTIRYRKGISVKNVYQNFALSFVLILQIFYNQGRQSEKGAVGSIVEVR